MRDKKHSFSHVFTLEAGLIPAAFAVALMKSNVVASTDLFANSGEIWSNLLSHYRAWITIQSFGIRVLNSGHLLLLYYAAIVGLTDKFVARRFGKIGLVLVATTLGGYLVIYMITPYPLQDHIDSSLDRLLLQLWPMFVFFTTIILK